VERWHVCGLGVRGGGGRARLLFFSHKTNRSFVLRHTRTCAQCTLHTALWYSITCTIHFARSPPSASREPLLNLLPHRPCGAARLASLAQRDLPRRIFHLEGHLEGLLLETRLPCKVRRKVRLHHQHQRCAEYHPGVQPTRGLLLFLREWSI
jgi:hypothetical protein